MMIYNKLLKRQNQVFYLKKLKTWKNGDKSMELNELCI